MRTLFAWCSRDIKGPVHHFPDHHILEIYSPYLCCSTQHMHPHILTSHKDQVHHCGHQIHFITPRIWMFITFVRIQIFITFPVKIPICMILKYSIRQNIKSNFIKTFWSNYLQHGYLILLSVFLELRSVKLVNSSIPFIRAWLRSFYLFNYDGESNYD